MLTFLGTVLAIIILYLNLLGFKQFFKSKERKQAELDIAIERIKEVSDNKEDYVATGAVAMSPLILLYLIYYLMFGIHFGHNTILIVYSALMFTRTIANFQVTISCIKSNIYKEIPFQRLSIIFNTCMVVYFVISFLGL